ncbi:hypothetical protein Pan216_27180 [Planctomycetes bacterium Pan216]|uniref:Uncharacterized protein n=1 Tax=Kolteria novifilia TaxID=2527975 RepID=A0A518B4D3_9BACT|nr:hypothetical protein Pan216_27180 [Planctomycetes bacterium Pan216]
MSDFHPAEYGPVFAELIDAERLPSLGPGTPDRELRGRLSSLTASEAFAHVPMAEKTYSAACLSGLWLLHDFLEESHTISQQIGNATGSFWHGIMHRREGDFGNSKYWFRRVGHHPVFVALARETTALTRSQNDLPAEAEYLTEQSDWDPYRFVDLCEQFVGSGTQDETFLQHLQMLEWQLLFDDSYRHAVAV